MLSLQETVLVAFTNKPRSCIHQLTEATGLARSELRYALVELQKLKLIRRVSEVKDDYVYELVEGSEKVVQHHTQSVLPDTEYAFRIDMETAERRVCMIKHMKARLIPEWHPILDKLLEDYENGLKAINIARRRMEDEEPEDYFMHVTTGAKNAV